MTEKRFSLSEFIEGVKDESYIQIILRAENECEWAESISYGGKGSVRYREMGSTRYAAEVKQFLFYMRSGMKPGSVWEHNWQMYRKVAERLVEKGEFKRSALDVFNP